MHLPAKIPGQFKFTTELAVNYFNGVLKPIISTWCWLLNPIEEDMPRLVFGCLEFLKRIRLE